MRDMLIIIGMCAAAIAVGAWLYFYGPTQAGVQQTSNTVASVESASAKEEKPASTPVTFGVIGHGSKAIEVTARKNYAVYTKEEYERIWKLTGSTEKMPTVDFKKGYVIAVFAGTRPTGGYAISVDGVSDTEDARSVSVLIEKPGVGCITSQALTSPYQIIRVPFSAHPLSHVDTEKEVPCDQ